MRALEFVVAGGFAAIGLVSLRRWLDTGIVARTVSEHILFALHRTARVGLWFAFGGFFLGYALVRRPETLRWYILVPIALACIQLLTTVLLGRSDPGPRPGRPGGTAPPNGTL